VKLIAAIFAVLLLLLSWRVGGPVPEPDCLPLASASGTDTIPVLSEEIERNLLVNRINIQGFVQDCPADDCVDGVLDRFRYNIQEYFARHLRAINQMHAQFGPAGVDFIQRHFENGTDRQIVAHIRSHDRRRKFSEISLSTPEGVYYHLLIKSGGKPVPICQRPKG
jgi:hypothetical protein